MRRGWDVFFIFWHWDRILTRCCLIILISFSFLTRPDFSLHRLVRSWSWKTHLNLLFRLICCSNPHSLVSPDQSSWICLNHLTDWYRIFKDRRWASFQPIFFVRLLFWVGWCFPDSLKRCPWWFSAIRCSCWGCWRCKVKIWFIWWLLRNQ